MPRDRKDAKPPHTHPELVEELAKEMKKSGVSSTPTIPTVYEEEQRYSKKLHVSVIWSKWTSVPMEERGAIILDAYVRAGLEEEMRRITVALGLTPEEAERMGRP